MAIVHIKTTPVNVQFRTKPTAKVALLKWTYCYLFVQYTKTLKDKFTKEKKKNSPLPTSFNDCGLCTGYSLAGNTFSAGLPKPVHQFQIDLVEVAAAILLHHFQIYGALERRRGQPGSTFLLQTGQEVAAIRKVMQECGPSLVY